jgi:penicillin G amidase
MPAPHPSRSVKRRQDVQSKRLLRRILFIIIILLIAGAAGGAWWWARQSLPPLDGEQRLTGLIAPVEVLFDSYGVPHVYAAGAEDAWAAAGVLHARDRLWQMELYRRAAYGRLSEILGQEALPFDKRLITLGLQQAAEAEWNAASPTVKAALTRYADGVNQQMARGVSRNKPLEFQLLRFDPAPWTPIDSLAVGRLLAWRLAENHQSELVRHALVTHFGAVEGQRLAGAYPVSAPTVLSGEPSPPPAIPKPTTTTTATVPRVTRPARDGAPIAGPATERAWPSGLEWLDPAARRGLSNNFVVSGQRTTSGRPLLANDPHLQIEFPSVWYEMHLVASDLDVIGVTLPGTPFVIIGHNGRIAWGLTNTGADVQDFYVERIDLARRRYMYRGQWLPVEITNAQIPVRNGTVEPFEVWRTQHGAVFADVGLEWKEPPTWLSRGDERNGERRVYALKWDLSGETAGAFEALNRANNWSEFTAAVEHFHGPSQNFVYADVDGNVGYAMSGSLPRRASGNGSTPLDGVTGEGEWTGHVDPSTLPRAFNPPAGYITSSNNEIDRRFAGLITRDWAAPFRASRLHQALSSNPKLGVRHATQLQNDIENVAADRVLAGVDSAINAGRASNGNAAALQALEQLRSWDRKVDRRPVVALYEAFEDALWRRTFIDEMGNELFDRFYEWAGAERPSGLYAVIDDAASKWFEDISTIDRRESRDDIYLLAARDAVDRLERDYGQQKDWNWAKMHAARFAHPLSAGGYPLRLLFDRGPTELGGDGTTVMRVSYNRMRPFQAWEVPSWRQVLDVGSWDDSKVVLPTGQSGHPLSPNYFDQNAMWREGQYRSQPFTRAAVDAARVHRLFLLP